MQGDLSRQATAWLVQLDDEPGNDDLRARFMEWLAGSPAHLEAWKETARVSDLISAAGPLPRARPDMPPGLARLGWLRKMPSVKALACVAAAACLAWVVVPNLSLRLRSDAITGTAELRLVRLDDGSRVHLAPATAIAFTDDAKGRTLNLLQGEAWFDVTHDRARPFRVLAGESTVTVLGTAFSVRRTDEGLDVAVERGHVAVSTSDGPSRGRVDLLAGQSVSVSDGAATRGQIRADRVASWREGVAIVKDRPIGEVLDHIRPWYGGYIVARGPGLKDRRVSGLYDLRHPDRALTALARAHKVTVFRVSPWLRIVTVG